MRPPSHVIAINKDKVVARAVVVSVEKILDADPGAVLQNQNQVLPLLLKTGDLFRSEGHFDRAGGREDNVVVSSNIGNCVALFSKNRNVHTLPIPAHLDTTTLMVQSRVLFLL